MAKKHDKPTTLDDLAQMINQGFSETQQYIDQRLGKMDEQLDTLRGEMSDLKSTMKDMVEELNATHEDGRYVRNTVTMLVRHDATHEAAIESLRKRIERVEKKVGIAQ